jgi:hypothetical protein
MDYATLIATKADHGRHKGTGFAAEASAFLFPFQHATVEWAAGLGRAAIFADTGLGKSAMQLDWARLVNTETRKPVLILTPLAVGAQTVREAAKFGIEDVAQARDQSGIGNARIVVTNYERLHLFDPASFGGVVLDESSILKNYTGKTKRQLVESFQTTPYRLACTATPAPNDYLELGNHAEFLGVMSSHKMIARWFISDQSEAGKYRLKGHAIGPYWDWVTSWARCIGVPSDMGDYSDAGYVLPELRELVRLVDVDQTRDTNGLLFREAELSATGLHREGRIVAPARAEAVAELVRAEPAESWIVWVGTNYDADEVLARLPGAIDVRGSHSPDEKAERLTAFSVRGGVIVTKPEIAGMGLNWQHCARMAFNGLSYSYEQYYQAVRRSWRFGQPRPVDAYVVLGRTEAPILSVIERKSDEHVAMKVAMFAASRRAASRVANADLYQPTHRARIPTWLRGDL